MSADTLGIVYAAKSSPDEGGSIEEQIEDVREMFGDEDREVIAVFSEENVSAYKGNRGKELEAAIRLAKERGATIGVQSPDRLARGNVKDARHLVEIAIEALTEGFALASVEEPETFSSLSAVAAAGDQSHLYVKKLASRVKKGHRRSRKQGNPGGDESLGYRFLRKAKPGRETPREVRVVPAKAVIVVRIYDEFLAGLNQSEIARRLTRDKVPTATGGGKWDPSTVGRMLKNPVYTGLVRQGGRKGTEFVEADYERIIERGKWEAVQAMIASKPGASYSRGRKPSGSHLFRRGLLRCECGAAMVPRTEKRGRECYRCHARLRDSASCSMPPIKRAEVDSAVYAYFSEVCLDVEATREQLREARNQKLAEVKALLASAERDVAEAAGAVARIERDYTRGKLGVEDWERLGAKLASELEAAEAERDRLGDQTARVEGDADLLATETQVVEELARLRSAIAGELTDAEGIDAMRAVLVRQFDSFVLHREGMTAAPRPEDWEPLQPEVTDVLLDDDPLDGQRWIEPVPSDHAIQGYDENLRPVLRREPLAQAGNKYAPDRTGS